MQIKSMFLRTLFFALFMMMVGCSDSDTNGTTDTPPPYAGNPAFVTTWQTDAQGGSSDNEIKISTEGSTGHLFTIDWGDGVIEAELSGDNLHAYDEPGLYTVKITGDFPRLSFNEWDSDANKLRTVEHWGDMNWTSMAYAFKGCSYLRINADDLPDLSQVTEMQYMFSGTLLFNDDISGWDTANVTDMSHMFDEAYSFDQDIGSWDVRKVTNMEAMFRKTVHFDQPLSAWKTESLVDVRYMFQDAEAFDQPLESWMMGHVTSLYGMFMGTTKFNQPLGEWNTSSVTNMAYTFTDATAFNQTVGEWNTSSVTYMTSMFENVPHFNQPLGQWDTSSVQGMSSMFKGDVSFDQPLSGWDTQQVRNMQYMFEDASSFDQDIGHWDTSALQYATSMFKNATSFDQFLDWDISSALNLQFMMENSGLSRANYDQILVAWGGQSVQNGVYFSAGSTQYSNISAVISAHDTLTDTYHWNITDGGMAP